jgi:hypothetical protein
MNRTPVLTALGLAAALVVLPAAVDAQQRSRPATGDAQQRSRPATGRAVPRTTVPGPGYGAGRVYRPYYGSNRPYYGPYYRPYYYGPYYYRPYYYAPFFGISAHYGPFAFGYGFGYPYAPYAHYGYPGYGYPGYGYPGYGYPAYGYPYRPYGGVRIDIPQRDGEVYVDGNFAGIVDNYDGNFQQLNLEPGTHTVEVRAPGFSTVNFDVNVEPGRTITYRTALRPAP